MWAAGGLVLCGGHVLLIRKHGLWDIPKGKRKKKEPATVCAVREISEETGLDPQMLRPTRLICQSSYISYYSGEPYNKTVDWFLLDYSGELTDRLAPDFSEDIDLCRWIAATDVSALLRTGRRYLQPILGPIEESLTALVS